MEKVVFVMYSSMKLIMIALITISLSACFSSTRTKYRSGPATTDGVTAAERDRLQAERDRLQAERDALKVDFGDDFSGPTTTSVALAAVTRVQRIIGQTIGTNPTFNPHQLGGRSANGQFNFDANIGMRNPDALAIRTEARLYPRDGGNPMLFAASRASTDEFPARGDVFRPVSYLASDGWYPGATTGRLTIQGTTNAGADYRFWQNPVLTSFQFTRGGDNPGMVMKFGADENGGATFSDLDSYAGWECAANDADCNAHNTHDIRIGFGANRHRNPAEGALAYYWRSLVPNHHKDSDGEVLVPGETITVGAETYTVTDDVGAYTLELTHAATGLEDAADADADRRYLSYAAYGLFNFFDKYQDVVTRVAGVGRMQTISYGLDAFADTDNMRTTDLTEENKIEATFKGRTMAYLVHLASGSAARRAVTQLTRMRGDISLTANIGPANPSDTARNTITGTISGLEYYTPAAASWGNTDITGGANTAGFSFATAFAADTATLTLENGVIAADGSYTGDVTPTTANTAYFDGGSFKGNLYGPLDGLETAGTWWLPAKDTADIGVGGVIGSFGACQDDKGRC